MSRPLLTLLRRRLPRWLAPVLVLMLLCQQVAVAAHVCVLPEPVAAQSASCGADMDDGEASMTADCAAHCVDPVQHTQDALALGVPPLPLPAMALPRALLAAANAPPGRDDPDPAARAWRQAHAATVLLI